MASSYPDSLSPDKLSTRIRSIDDSKPGYIETVWRRFTKRVRVTKSKCWDWLGCISTSGYGKMALGRGCYLATHRFAYYVVKGDVRNGLEVDHLCRNTKCCNPMHLEAVTRSVNQRRGVGFVADKVAQTTCIRGHALSGDNLIIRSNGSRRCRECARTRCRNWFRKQALNGE